MSETRQQWFIRTRARRVRNRLTYVERRAARVRSTTRRSAAQREVTRLRYLLARLTGEMRSAAVAEVSSLLNRRAAEALARLAVRPARLDVNLTARPTTDAPVLVLTAPRGPTSTLSTVTRRVAATA